MKKHIHRIFRFIRLPSLLFAANIFSSPQEDTDLGQKFLMYQVNSSTQQIRMYWQDERTKAFGSILNLKNWLAHQGKDLVFATNGGMYQTDQKPLGLYIQNGHLLHPLNTAVGSGNFYLEPNGIFGIDTNQKPFICKTRDFVMGRKILFATQSGPMLVTDSILNSAFKQGSHNLNIRNGVGILPNGSVLFVMSKQAINFYDFAQYFKHLGCKNALYLDGFVSRTYLPEKNWRQTDGHFGVIIAVTSP